MKVNLVELTGNGKNRTKKELMNEFKKLAVTLMMGNHFAKQNPYWNKLCDADAVCYIYQHKVLTSERSRLVEEYMSSNGFSDKEQNRIMAHLDYVYGNERLSYRIVKGFKKQIKSLKQGLDYVDEYKYTHINWNQTPILRASLPFDSD